jgi:hypothetical protein
MDHPREVAASAVWARARPLVLVPVLALFSLVGGLFPSFSLLANLYVLLLGGAMIWLALSGRLTRRLDPGVPSRPADPAPPGLSADPDLPRIAADPGLAGLPARPEPPGLPAGLGLPALPAESGLPAAAPGPGPPVPARAAGRPPVGAIWWLAPVLLLAGVELVDFWLGSTRPHPTLSGLMDPLLEHRLARAAGYFCWLTAFVGLARR